MKTEAKPQQGIKPHAKIEDRCKPGLKLFPVKVEDEPEEGSRAFPAMIDDGPELGASAMNGDDDRMDIDIVDRCDSDSEEDLDAEPTFHEADEIPTDLTANLDEELQRQQQGRTTGSRPARDYLANGTAGGTPAGSVNDPPHSIWRNLSQGVLFRQGAQKVADDYLEHTGEKVRAARRQACKISDHRAYHEGWDDSKKLDVRGNRIEDGEAE